MIQQNAIIVKLENFISSYLVVVVACSNDILGQKIKKEQNRVKQRGFEIEWKASKICFDGRMEDRYMSYSV